MKAKIIEDLCFGGCGFCAKVCPKGEIGIVSAKTIQKDEECEGFAVCVEECTKGAITVVD